MAGRPPDLHRPRRNISSHPILLPAETFLSRKERTFIREEKRVLDEAQARTKRGAVTVLAFFVAMLFAQGGAVSAAQLDARNTARLGQADFSKPALAHRAAVRGQADEGDGDVLLPPPTRVESAALTRRPAADAAPLVSAGPPALRRAAYRARAPPAA